MFQGQGGAGNSGPTPEQQEEKARQMTEMKNGILSQVLDQSARTRCKFEWYIELTSIPCSQKLNGWWFYTTA